MRLASRLSHKISSKISRTLGVGGSNSGPLSLSVPSALRQLLFHDDGDQSYPAYYTEEEWPGHSHLLKDYSTGVGSLREKRLGYCYDFDGTNDYVTTGVPSNFANDYVIFVEFKADTVSGTNVNVAQRLVQISNVTASRHGMGIDDSKLVMFYNTGIFTITTGTAITASTNHKACIRSSGTSLQLYLNGTLVETVTSTVLSPNSATAKLGAAPNGNDLHYDGKMWNVQFYDAPLTQAQCEQLTTDGNIVNSASIYAHYPLQEESGTTAFDISGNDNHGTIMGAVTSGVGSIHQPDAGVFKSYPNDEGYSAYQYWDGTGDGVNLASDIVLSGAFDVTFECVLDDLTNSYHLAVNATGPERFFITGAGAAGFTDTSTVSTVATVSTIVPNKLLNIRFVRDGSNNSSVTVNGVTESLGSTLTGNVVIDALGLIRGDSTGILAFKGFMLSADFDANSYVNPVTASGDWPDRTGSNDGTKTGTNSLTTVPAKSSTLDAIGGALTHTGRAPQPGLVKDWAWQGDDSVVYVQLTDTSLLSKLNNNSGKFSFYYDGSAGNLFASSISTSDRFAASTAANVLSVGVYNGSSWAVKSANVVNGNWYFVEWEYDSSGHVMSAQMNGIEMVGTAPPNSSANPAFILLASTLIGAQSGCRLSPLTITTGGVTTTFSPIKGTRDVAVTKSDGTHSVISNAVKNGVLANLYTLGDGSWRSPAVENGGHWDGTSLIPAAPGASVAVNGNALNIPANKHPIGLLVDRTGNILAPLDYQIGTDAYDEEAYDDTTTENTVDKRISTNYSDRHGAALVDISGESYFD